MPVYTDQLGNTVDIPSFPQRIISLVPSQTELLFHVGLGDRVVGITKFCVHPAEWFRIKTRIGGTKAVKMEVVLELQPDLILANKEENVKEQVEELAKQYPVWVSDVFDLESALDMIRKVGIITGTGEKADGIVERINAGFKEFHYKNSNYATPTYNSDHIIPMKNSEQEFQLDNSNQPIQTQNSQHRIPAIPIPNLRCAYLIWRNPYMTIGGDTFIHDMLNRCGLQNVFGELTRYPAITIDDLRNKNCQLLLLSSEPYPFKENHIAELQKQLPGTKILLVDGEMFSWYGSRLLESPPYFKELLKQIV